ncbi:precorrin-6y C5,15-methyltransferase (decarboxylating) subunit CbiE [Sporomusaceae bacterium FL31]|nr:precorrin-6y C5,15-methyltransferase (decarboxylating) subunit CbiE [Sporomusaceae bacterium FL31]GCE33475.1 precorrin-6y C5,15-methyltransferase (decarboxylating) subunit CbiE [Sporomusaceae bacterium]
MGHKVIVVGIGPGSPDYLVPIAKQTIDDAKVIVGSKRALDTLATATSIKKVIGGNIAEVLEFIELNLSHDDVVVMVSGDPGYYSLLATLRKTFSIQQLKVIPGISSFQAAFARLALPWQDATLVSMHGREPELNMVQYGEGKILGILTDTYYNPSRIAQLLLALGWPSPSQVFICAQLSYENEEIIQSDLTQACSIDGFSHCVMVVME